LARENLNDRTNVHSIDIKKKNGWKTIYEYQSDIKTHTFAGLSSDNQGIVFTRDDDDVGYLLLSLADGSVTEIKELSLERDTTGLIKNEHGVVVGMKYAGFTPDYKILDQEVNKRLEDIVARFEGQSVHLVDWTPDWKHLVVRVEGSSYVGDYLVFTQGKQPFKLASSRLSISGEQINPVVIENYTSRDGIEIPTLLTFPRDRATTPNNLPTVILPHGGPAAQDRMGFNYKAQALASRGFLVIQPQFRGSTGFGTKLYEAGWGEWGKGMQNDLTDAIKAFKEKGFVDSNKVCIVGSSYGGYAALAGAAFTPDLYKCAVSINGVSHLPKMLAADKKRYGKKSWVLDYWNRSILNSDFDRESLKASSPYYSADKIKVPVLLIHGEDDKIVEINQSKLMHKAIKKKKTPLK